MTRRSLAFTLVPAALIAIACSSGTEASDTAAPVASVKPSESPLHFPAWERTNSPCCPWRPIPAANVTAYVTTLTAISPALTKREDRAISDGENTCLALKAKETDSVLLSTTKQRFVRNDYPTVGDAAARQIIAAAKKYLCPKV